MSRRDGSIYKDVTVVSAVANRSRIVCKCNEEKRLVRWQRRKAGKVLRFVSVFLGVVTGIRGKVYSKVVELIVTSSKIIW